MKMLVLKIIVYILLKINLLNKLLIITINNY